MEERYLMAYDALNGEIKGFYPVSLLSLYTNILEPTLEISESEHLFYIGNNGLYKINVVTLERELIPIPEPIPQPKTDSERITMLEEAFNMMIMM